MATVTGMTAAAMEAIRDEVVVDANVVGDNLILTTYDGTLIDAGNVRGATGATSNPSIVTSLPGSPSNGDEVYYQSSAMAALGVAWHLKYRSAASGSYKWESVGPGVFYTQTSSGGTGSISAGTWSNAPTTQCDVTLPLSGDYEVSGQSIINTAVAGIIIAGVAVGTGGAPDQLLQSAQNSGAGAYVSASVDSIVTGRTAADVLRWRYYNSSAGSIVVSGTTLKVKPIRVG